MQPLKIGVLALQGDFAEHIAMLRSIGVEAVEVRLPEDLDPLDGLILPGGESTTIGKLAVHYQLMQPLRAFGEHKPIWGTCAGAILLSQDAHRDQPLLGLMDITVARNAFGRQIDSFEVELDIPALRAVDPAGKPYLAVFIRAPLIEAAGPDVEVLAFVHQNSSNGSDLAAGSQARGAQRIVAARQGHLLATSFHPELTADDRFHRYFVKLVEQYR